MGWNSVLLRTTANNNEFSNFFYSQLKTLTTGHSLVERKNSSCQVKFFSERHEIEYPSRHLPVQS